MNKPANNIVGKPVQPEPGMRVEPQAGEPAVVLPEGTPEERSEALRRLFAEWMADESGYDEETFPQLKAALEETRKSVSARPLFND